MLLQFSALGCETCVTVALALKELDELRDDVHILIIQYTSSVEDNLLYKEHLALPFNILSASEEMAKKYEAYMIPFSILIDEEGKVAWTQRLETLEGFTLFLNRQS